MTDKSLPKLPTEKPKKGKFTNDEVMKIVYWQAIFKPPLEIIDLVQEEFGKSIGKTAIAYYRDHPRYVEVKKKIRERWGNEIFDVELSHKRRRLEEMQKIYYECRASKDRKTALSALFQIQHEVEKDLQNLSLTNYNINVYKDMTDAELEEERVKSLERLKTLRGEIECAKNPAGNQEPILIAEEMAEPVDLPQNSENEKAD